jgi:hypothetical protein
MNKNIYLILLIILILNLLPTVSAFEGQQAKQAIDPDIINRTFIRGFILFPRETNNGKTLTFYAIRIHYTSYNIDGAVFGNIRLRSVTIPNKLTGYTNRFYIIGTFHGSLLL